MTTSSLVHKVVQGVVMIGATQDEAIMIRDDQIPNLIHDLELYLFNKANQNVHTN